MRRNLATSLALLASWACAPGTPAAKKDDASNANGGPVATETAATTATGTATGTASGTDTSTGTTTTSDTGTGTNAAQTHVTFSGQVILDPNISQPDTLTPSAAIAGATVFVKGFPDQTATTDAQGAFTLALDLSGAGLVALPDHFDVILWHTTPGASGKKYGVQKDAVAATPDEPAALGTVELGYTQLVRFTVQDGGVTVNDYANQCAVTFPGYEGRLDVMIENGNDLKVDYLPPATYTVSIACAGHAAKTRTFKIPTGSDTAFDPAQGFPNWQRITLDLQP